MLNRDLSKIIQPICLEQDDAPVEQEDATVPLDNEDGEEHVFY